MEAVAMQVHNINDYEKQVQDACQWSRRVNFSGNFTCFIADRDLSVRCAHRERLCMHYLVMEAARAESTHFKTRHSASRIFFHLWKIL
jgi:hypothetical protein